MNAVQAAASRAGCHSIYVKGAIRHVHDTFSEEDISSPVVSSFLTCTSLTPILLENAYTRRDGSAPTTGVLPLTFPKRWAHDVLDLANRHPGSDGSEPGLAIPLGINRVMPVQSRNRGEQYV